MAGWLAWVQRLPEAVRPRAELLYEEHDLLRGLRREAQKSLLARARSWASTPRSFPVRYNQTPLIVTGHKRDDPPAST